MRPAAIPRMDDLGLAIANAADRLTLRLLNSVRLMRESLPALTVEIMEKTIQRGIERRFRRAGAGDARSHSIIAAPTVAIPERFYRFDLHPGYRQLRVIADGAARLRIDSSSSKRHEGIAGGRTWIGGREYLNFSSHNYLGLSGHIYVSAAAKSAIDRYGTSVSASRYVSGERPVHRRLEAAIAGAYRVDDAVIFAGEHATHAACIGCLFEPHDLIVYDEGIEDSTQHGLRLSGAHCLPFPHGDGSALDRLLSRHRREFQRVLVVVEGIYGLDGDVAPIPHFIDIKRRHKVFLMVDEAHSFGVMGATGLGIREHFSLAGEEVDIWMGTLSKALAGCGGYIAGSKALVEQLKWRAPAFLHGLGMAPALAASALAALEHLGRDPARVAALHARASLFLQLARAAGVNTGRSAGISIVPAIVASSARAARLAAALFQRGIHVQPELYPAVPEKRARLRFFMSCEHSEWDIRRAVGMLATELKIIHS
jgi:8-amino-7-oxononanoate synthase